jgi:mannitol 2-dehydrogenase
MNLTKNPVLLMQAKLGHVLPEVRTPAYDRAKISKSIVHIGVGGFYRAHQAVYLDDLLHRPGSEEWGYCGVGLLAQDARIGEILRQQDCLYTVVERSTQGDRARVIGSLLEFLHAPADPEAVLGKMASPECRIVSLTITESGYYVNQGTGEFDESHPDVVHDLANPQAPRFTFGYLAEALDRRRRRGLAPFTVMSCDNLQGNGDIARKMLLEFTRRRDPELSRWIDEHGAFPNSMVDRITPATKPEHCKMVADAFGIQDGWPVVTEPFRQWVLEDNFPGGRPAWQEVGVQMTSNVLPYEKMKLRLLNASHQAICYIGMLLGYQFSDEAMANPNIRILMQRMMDEEVTQLLDRVEGVDLEAYKAGLVERFSNSAIRDQLARIGTEGSARIPKFILPSILDQLQRNGPVRLLSFTVACWFRYLAGHDDQGRPLPLVDPMAEKLREHALNGRGNPGPLLGIRELFGDVLPAAPGFVGEVGRALADLYEYGAALALERVLTPRD